MFRIGSGFFGENSSKQAATMPSLKKNLGFKSSLEDWNLDLLQRDFQEKKFWTEIFFKSVKLLEKFY